MCDGPTEFTVKCGLCSLTKSHTAFSASALLAEYTTAPRIDSGAERDQASRMASSLYVFSSTCVVSPGSTKATATTELVYTNSFTDGSFSAACRMPVAPLMVCGMTSLGSGEKVTTEATCAMAETPLIESSKAWSAARSGTRASSKSPRSA